MLGSDRYASAEAVATNADMKTSSGEGFSPSRGLANVNRRSKSTESTMPTARRRGAGLRQPRGTPVLLSLLPILSTAMADCISLKGSTTCPAFEAASIATSDYLTGLYPFLKYVSDRESFDKELTSYISTSYVQEKYENLLGCGSINLSNTTDLYARFTKSTICNAIIQNSIHDCNLSGDAARPLCADSCAEFAESEAYITADSALCTDPGNNSETQIRADFTNCALPADSLSSGGCIEGITNEPDNCGYEDSLIGLCSYCKSGGINSTDTCCYNSGAETKCANVTLPSISASVTLVATATATATTTSTAAASGVTTHKGLSSGATAGIVIGSVVAAALLAFLLFMCIRLARRRRGDSVKGSIFNQPSPSKRGPAMTQAGGASSTTPQGYDALHGGRIARMSALEHQSEGSQGSASRNGDSRHGVSRGTAAAGGAAAGYMAGRRRPDSSSDEYEQSPESEPRASILRPPPTSRRQGSLSSNSLLAGDDTQSRGSAGGMSSPQGVAASQQSEQLPFFKDYYSQDDIHPGDRVAVLWAYQPRAADEFALERGDMLKVVGIWDDGWATGVMVDERADEWEARRQAQRDSGVSSASGHERDTSPPVSGEIKAFPLVCVCLPEHWRKTIEGDGSTETGSSGQGAQRI